MEEYLIRNIEPEGTVVLVKPDGTGDYTTIQAAINAVYDGYVIELADGTYTGDGNRDIDYKGKAITIRSQSGNPELCIIDCQGSESDPHRGFYFHLGEGSGSVIQGLTITNGYITEGNGGGIYCMYGASPSLDNSIIAFSTQGEAVYCTGGCYPALACCDIYGNLGGDWIGCIEDQYGINGNFSADPLFCEPDSGNYYIQEISPCAPEQQPECGLIGALDVGCYGDLTVTLTPDATVVERGGSLGYTIEVANTTAEDKTFAYWSDIFLWTGEPYNKNPVFGPKGGTLKAGKTKTTHITHKVPNNTPLKTYTLCGRIGNYPGDIWEEDCFEFTVISGIVCGQLRFGEKDWEVIEETF